jgi:hypothetical protein
VDPDQGTGLIVIAPALSFDEPTHTYRFAGRVVPSVTQVLEHACRWDFITPEQLEAAGRRGTYIHQLAHLSDLDELDDDRERDGEHWQRLLAWRAFCRDYGANWSAMETQGYSQLFGFAGTVDRRGLLERHSPSDRWVIDIKSSEALGKTWGPQTAAYKQIAIEEDSSWAFARRATVRLLANGTYKFDECKDREDWPLFKAMLTIHYWSKK